MCTLQIVQRQELLYKGKKYKQKEAVLRGDVNRPGGL